METIGVAIFIFLIGECIRYLWNDGEVRIEETKMREELRILERTNE